MDIKKRLGEELKKVGEDKEQIREGFERRAVERRKWAIPLIEAAQTLETETAGRPDLIWDIEEMGAGVRLGKVGKRGYRQIQISVVAPQPDQDSATFVARQTDAIGKQISETVFDNADVAIQFLIHAVGEYIANHPDSAGETTGSGVVPVSVKKDKAGARPLTYLLVVLLGIFSLLAGWYLVAVMQAVPEDLANKGAQTVGGIWERLRDLID
ncbi:MAG: hypothetical protein HQ511_13075 [Rhodospirillales bacterium]|nr:hypothetical protein [Rhodospirillales bacterium]